MHNFKIITEGRVIPNVTLTLVDRACEMDFDQWSVDRDGNVSARETTRDQFLNENKGFVERVYTDKWGDTQVKMVLANTYNIV